MTAPSRRPGVLRVAGSTLLLTCLLLGLGSLMSSPVNAAPTPTPTPGAPGSTLGSGLIFDPLNPAVEPVTPTDPLAVFTQGPPPTFPFTTTTAPLSLGSVPVATTLPVAPSVPPAPVGPNGCLNLGAAAGPLQIAAPCDSPGGQTVTAVVKVVSFAEDPLGWLTDKMGQGASGIMSWVADTANNATAADLTNSWWIDAYKKAFAVAVILFGMLTLWNMSQLGRGKIGPEEFADTITIRSWGFFGGVIFGPPLAKFFIEGAGILSRGVISAMPGYSGGKMDATTVNRSIQGASEGKIIGGAVIAFLMLAVIFSRPLLFFIVGLVMAMARAAVVQSSDDASTNLAMVIMVGVGLAIAAFSPLLLLKFAPVVLIDTSAAT